MDMKCALYAYVSNIAIPANQMSRANQLYGLTNTMQQEHSVLISDSIRASINKSIKQLNQIANDGNLKSLDSTTKPILIFEIPWGYVLNVQKYLQPHVTQVNQTSGDMIKVRPSIVFKPHRPRTSYHVFVSIPYPHQSSPVQYHPNSTI